MEWIDTIFGSGKDLNTLQMTCRGIAAFFVALVMIRLAGQRTFGKQSALDNVVMFMLGAVLSRAVVGASAILPVIGACAAMSLTHRILAWLSTYHDWIGRIVKGNEFCLYRNGREEKANMKKLLISSKDLMEGVRMQLNADTLENVDSIYIERNGELSVIKKESKN